MRTKSKEEQYLSDFLSKLGQGAGESGTIEVDALAALGTIEHRIDEMLDPKTAAREEYHDLLAAALCYDAHASQLDAESKRILTLATQARERAANLKECANL